MTPARIKRVVIALMIYNIFDGKDTKKITNLPASFHKYS